MTISFADMSDELRMGVWKLACAINTPDFSEDQQMALSWLEAMGPQEFLEMMGGA